MLSISPRLNLYEQKQNNKTLKTTPVSRLNQLNKDTISFSGLKPEGAETIAKKARDATIELRTKLLTDLFGIPVKCKPQSELCGFGTYYQSANKYTMKNIKNILTKVEKALAKEEEIIKSYKSEEKLGEFASALHKFEIKSQYVGNEQRGLEIYYPDKDKISKSIKNGKNEKSHLEFCTQNWESMNLYRNGLVDKKFICEEMIDIIAQKSKEKPFEICHNSETFRLNNIGRNVEILKVG